MVESEGGGGVTVGFQRSRGKVKSLDLGPWHLLKDLEGVRTPVWWPCYGRLGRNKGHIACTCIYIDFGSAVSIAG